MTLDDIFEQQYRTVVDNFMVDFEIKSHFHHCEGCWFNLKYFV